jgi:hypothetical protein
MRVKSIYCECGLRRDFIAEELAERWDIPENDPVWQEYTFWRDYIEQKKSGQNDFPEARADRWRDVTGQD